MIITGSGHETNSKEQRSVEQPKIEQCNAHTEVQII